MCGRGNIRKTQGPRNAVATGLVLSLIHISMFNRPVALVSRWIYTQQINDLISKSAAGWQSFAVIAVNALAGITAFAVIYKKRGLLF